MTTKPPGLLHAETVCNQKTSKGWIIVDNSRSMLKRDSLLLVSNGIEECTIEDCTRWKEVSVAVTAMAIRAEASATLTEVRLLNKALPVIVGSSSDEVAAKDRMEALFNSKPQGLTPLCTQLEIVREQLTDQLCREMRVLDKLAVLVIMTDGESTDGDVAELLQPLKNHPVRVIIRLCSEESDVVAYWNNTAEFLHTSCPLLPVTVLGSHVTVASNVALLNPWLTYGEPLHRAREYGVTMVPSMDLIASRKLDEIEIRSVIEMLLQLPSSSTTTTSSNSDWPIFIASVRAAVFSKTTSEGGQSQGQGQWYCPARRRYLPWINLDELEKLRFPATNPTPIAAAAVVVAAAVTPVAVVSVKSDVDAVSSGDIGGGYLRSGLDPFRNAPQSPLSVPQSPGIRQRTLPTPLANTDKQQDMGSAEVALALDKERQQSSLQHANELSRLTERHRVIVEDMRMQARQDAAEQSAKETELKSLLDKALQRVSLLELQATEHEAEMQLLKSKVEGVSDGKVLKDGVDTEEMEEELDYLRRQVMALTMEKERARELCASRDRTIADLQEVAKRTESELKTQTTALHDLLQQQQQQQQQTTSLSSQSSSKMPIKSSNSADDDNDQTKSTTKRHAGSEEIEFMVDKAELAALRLDCTRQLELIKSHDEEVIALKSTIDTLEKSLKVAKEEYQALQMERDQLSIESAKTVETFMQSMALLQQELHYLENTQVVYLESELKDAKATSAALAEELAATRETTERTLVSPPLEQNSVENKQLLLDQIAALEQELIVTKTHNVDSRLQDNERAAQQIGTLEAERDTLAQKVTSLETQRNRLQDDIKSSQVTIKELRPEQDNNLHEESLALRQQLEDIKTAKSIAEQRISELESQVCIEQAELAALKARQISWETKREHDGMRIEELEKALAKGDKDLKLSTALVKSLQEEMESIKLKAATVSLSTATSNRDSDELIALRAQVASLTMAEINGNVNGVDHKVHEDTTQRMHALSTEVEMLTSKRAEEQTMASLAVQQSESLRAALIQSRDVIQQELVDTTVQLTELTKKLADEQVQGKATQLEAEKAQQELVNLKQQLVDLQTSSDQSIKDLQVQLRASTDEMASLRTQHHELLDVHAATTQQIKTLNEQVTAGARDKESSDARISWLEVQLKLSVDELAVFTSKQNDWVGEAIGKDEKILSLQSLLKQANDEIERLKGSLADTTSAKNAGDARISMLEGQGRDDADKIASLKMRVYELEAVLQRTREEMLAMTTKYSNVTASSAAANEEIVDLKNQLSARQTSSSHSIADLQAQLKSAKDQLTALADKHTELTVMNTTVNKHVEALMIQGKEDTNEITALKIRVSAFEVALKESEEKLAASTVAHTDATAAIAVADRKIAEWETTCKNKDIEIASLTEQQTNLRASNAAAANEAIEALKTELSALQTSSSQSLEDLQTQLKSVKDELTALADKHMDLVALHAVAEKRVEALVSQGKEDTNQVIALKTRVSEFELALKESEEKLAALTNTHADATAAMTVADRKIAEWETTCKNKDIEIASLTEQQINQRASNVAAANEAIEALKTELSALQKSSSEKIAQLEAQNRKSSDDAAVMTERYNELTIAKVSVDKQVEVLQVQSKKDMDDFVATSSATIAEKDQQIAALTVQSQKFTDEVASLNEQIFDLEAAVQQSREDELTAAAASAKASALAVDLAKSNDEIALMATKHMELSAMKAAAEEEIVGLKSQLSSLQMSSSQSITDLQAQLTSAQNDLVALTASSEATKLALDRQLVDLQTQLQNSVHEVSALTNTINELTTAKAAVEVLAAQAISDKTAADALINQIHEEQSKKDRDEIEGLRQQLAAARINGNDDFVRLTRQHDELLTSSAAAKTVGDKVISSLKNQLSELQASSEKTIANLQAQNDKSNGELATLTVSTEAAKSALNQEIVDLQTQLSALQASSSQSVSDLQAQLNKINQEASVLTKKNDDLATAKSAVDEKIVLLRASKDAADDHVRTLEAQVQEVDVLKEKNKEQMAIITAHEQEIHRLTSALNAQMTNNNDTIQSAAVTVASDGSNGDVVEVIPAETAKQSHSPSKSQPQQRPSLNRRESSASSLSLAISSVGDSRDDAENDHDHDDIDNDDQRSDTDSYHGFVNRSREGSLSLAPPSSVCVSMVSGSRIETHGTLSYSSRQSVNSRLGLIQYRGNGRNRCSLPLILHPLSNIVIILFNPFNYNYYYPLLLVSPSPPRSPHRRNSGSSGVNGRGGMGSEKSNRSGGGSPHRVMTSTIERNGTSNLPPATFSPTTTDLAAIMTVESVPSASSHELASTTSIDSRNDHSEGGKSRSSSSCSSGLDSVWSAENVIKEIRLKEMARDSNGEDDDDEEEGSGSDDLDGCGVSVSTTGSTDDGCLDAFLVDNDSGSDTGEGMSDVSSISSHGLSHGSEVSQSMLRNVAINTAFNKGFAQRRSVHDPLYHINPIIVPSPVMPSSPMQTKPSSPNRGSTERNTISNPTDLPHLIAPSATMTIKSIDLPSDMSNHRDDGEHGDGIVLVGVGEKGMQDLRGNFRGREEHKSPTKRVCFGTIMFPVPSPDDLDSFVDDDLDEDSNSPSNSCDTSIREEKRRKGVVDALEDKDGIVQIVQVGLRRGPGRGRIPAIEYVEDSDGEGASWGSSMGSNGESWGSSRASTTIRSGRTCSPVPLRGRSSHTKDKHGNDDDNDSSSKNNNNNIIGTAPSLFGGWFG